MLSSLLEMAWVFKPIPHLEYTKDRKWVNQARMKFWNGKDVKGGRIAFAPNKSNRPSFDTERQMHALARAAGSARDRLPHGLPNLLSACGFDHKSRHVAKSM